MADLTSEQAVGGNLVDGMWKFIANLGEGLGLKMPPKAAPRPLVQKFIRDLRGLTLTRAELDMIVSSLALAAVGHNGEPAEPAEPAENPTSAEVLTIEPSDRVAFMYEGEWIAGTVLAIGVNDTEPIAEVVASGVDVHPVCSIESLHLLRKRPPA